MSPCQSYNTLRHGQSQCQDKEFLIKERREQPNLESLDDTIMPHIYAMHSDETARRATERRERIHAVKEETDCRVSVKKHKRRSCKYSYKCFGMLGSHRSEKC